MCVRSCRARCSTFARSSNNKFCAMLMSFIYVMLLVWSLQQKADTVGRCRWGTTWPLITNLLCRNCITCRIRPVQCSQYGISKLQTNPLLPNWPHYENVRLNWQSIGPAKFYWKIEELRIFMRFYGNVFVRKLLASAPLDWIELRKLYASRT